MEIRVGFAGLGTMGKPMATNVLKKGYDLTVYDVVPQPVQDLVSMGAKSADSIRELAEKTDVVIEIVPEDKHVREVVYGADGFLEGARPGMTFISMSTSSPMLMNEIAKDLAVKEIKLLDAAAMGAVAGAHEGTLTIPVGGDADTFAKHKPLMDVMGTARHVGDQGCGKVVKIINNMIVGVVAPALAEAMVLGVKAGMKADVLVDVLEQSPSARCWVLSNYVKKYVLNGEFPTGIFGVDFRLKDSNLALDMSRYYHVPVPIAAAAHQLYEATRGLGYVKELHMVVIKQMEEVAGVKVRNPGVKD